MSPRGQRHICVSGAKLGILVTPAIAVLASGASTAAADTTINVNTPSDETTVGDGTCSLREALLFANGVQGGEDCGTGQSPGTVTILLPAQHYSLTQGVLTLERVDGQITIQGSGVGPIGTTIDAQRTSRAFPSRERRNGSDHRIDDHRRPSPIGPRRRTRRRRWSGRIRRRNLQLGTLALTDASVTGNASGNGGTGGDGTGTQTGGTGGAGGEGGGIFNSGSLFLTRVTVSTDCAGAGGLGGGMHGVNGRSAPPGGGGPGGFGGAIFNGLPGTLTVTDSTLAENAAGAGVPGARGAVLGRRGARGRRRSRLGAAARLVAGDADHEHSQRCALPRQRV